MSEEPATANANSDAEEDAEEPDLSKRPVGSLAGTELEWSTIPAQHRGSTKKKPCWLCGHEYSGGPALIRNHLYTNLIMHMQGLKWFA